MSALNIPDNPQTTEWKSIVTAPPIIRDLGKAAFDFWKPGMLRIRLVLDFKSTYAFWIAPNEFDRTLWIELPEVPNE